jgi:hypothetical protein
MSMGVPGERVVGAVGEGEDIGGRQRALKTGLWGAIGGVGIFVDLLVEALPLNASCALLARSNWMADSYQPSMSLKAGHPGRLEMSASME